MIFCSFLSERSIMDETGVFEHSSSLFLLLISPLLFFIISQLLDHFSLKRKEHFPPGPKPWPIVGNIHHMGEKPHISLANFAKLHGPLISLKLGVKVLVVASSTSAAEEILKTNDRILCARGVPPQVVDYIENLSFIWSAECSDRWRSLRSMCRVELFSQKAIESRVSLMEKKTSELVEYLGSKEGEVVSIARVVFITILNILSNAIFSRDFFGFGDEAATDGLRALMLELMENLRAPNISDFYPILTRLDLQGLTKKTAHIFNQICAIWEPIIRKRRENQGAVDLDKMDFLDVFLANGVSDAQINILVNELLIAGTDTITSTIEWAMTELMKNKESMNKLQSELTKKIYGNFIKEEDTSHLPYLNACIKETLRLHPPAPLLLPHRAITTCEIMDYTIPKDSEILVNVWAIGRDPNVWKEPLVFNPDRFLDSNLDYKGQDFELIPFGSGRRICPGLPLAAKQLNLILGNLVHFFLWSLPNNLKPEQIDMDEKFGLSLEKKHPLLLIPNKK